MKELKNPIAALKKAGNYLSFKRPRLKKLPDACNHCSPAKVKSFEPKVQVFPYHRGSQSFSLELQLLSDFWSEKSILLISCCDK